MSAVGVPPSLCRRFGRRDWHAIGHGMSGAEVWRFGGEPGFYLKIVSRADPIAVRELADEADRAGWLRAQGFPAADVIELDGVADRCWLLTRTLAGRPVSAHWAETERDRAIDAFADVARALHGLPVGSCPFDRSLAVTLPLARSAVESDAVDLQRLDPERQGRTGHQMLASLDAAIPDQKEDLVVCHGDLCLPNVLLDSVDMTVTGLVDVGRLGSADRYLDLALATRSIASESLNPQFGDGHVRRFLSRYGEIDPDPARIDFYRLLDEFF
jgi:aminoglycoside phosphotransferase